jgi:hypothetical protein
VLLGGLSRSDAFVAKPAAANYLPTIMASPTPSSTESFTEERKEGEQKRQAKTRISFLQENHELQRV